jgi:hypothetical protein
MAFVAIKIGRWQESGTIFFAILRGGAGWLFFCVTHSSRINSNMLVAGALKNSQLTPRPRGESHAISGKGH